MKPLSVLLVLPTLVLMPAVLQADEPPEKHLELVNGLRAKNYHDLALEHLEYLGKTNPKAYPGLRLEIAKSRVALALTAEPEHRAGMLLKAKRDFEAFLKENPSPVLAAETRFEIARLAAYQGKAKLSRSLRMENAEDQKAEALLARQQFVIAGEELTKSAQLLAAELSKFPKAGPEQAQLTQRKLEADIDVALNLLDRAETYGKSSEERRDRTKIIEEAKKIFESVRDQDTKNPLCHVARAWLIYCYNAMDDDRSFKLYKLMKDDKSKAAAKGKRLARYFYIRYFPLVGDAEGAKLKPADRTRKVREECEQWLKDYRAYRNTHEGEGIRFELGESYFREGLTLEQAKAKAAAEKAFKTARDRYRSLLSPENDFTEIARQKQFQCEFKLQGEGKKALEELQGFRKCYIQAQYHIFKMGEAAAKAPLTQEERQKYFKKVVAALTRALDQAERPPASKEEAEEMPTPQELLDARYALTYYFLASGDPYRSVILGEDLARIRPVTRKSALAAGYALEAYRQIVQRDNSDPYDRQQMMKLSLMIETDKAWENDPLAAYARYQRAILLHVEKEDLEAVDLLEQLSPDFSAYLYAQCQIVLFAMQGQEKKEYSDAQKETLLKKARAALQRLPKLPPQPDPLTAQMYFRVKIVQGNLMYQEAQAELDNPPAARKKYEALDTFVAQLLQRFDKLDVTLEPNVKDFLRSQMQMMAKGVKLGLANVEFRSGNYSKVLELIAPALAEVSRELNAREVAAQVQDWVINLTSPFVDLEGISLRPKDYVVSGEILGLALRAHVQQSKLAEAREDLKLLRRLTADDKEGDASGVILKSLVVELKNQVRELQKKGESAKEQLEKTIKNFSAFLDEYAREVETRAKQADAKGLVQDLIFLADSYSNLELHDKAARMYSKYPEPKGETGNPPDDKQVQLYWYFQVQYGRELRLAKKFNEAIAVLKRVRNDPRSKFGLLADKEQIHVLEDQGKFGPAVNEWTKMLNNPSVRNFNSDKGKEFYYDCYYHFTYCNYKYGLNHKILATKKEFIRRAADWIVRREKAANQDGWNLTRARFQELLASEAPLREAYEALKKGS
jgi:hypothetical protein